MSDKLLATSEMLKKSSSRSVVYRAVANGACLTSYALAAKNAMRSAASLDERVAIVKNLKKALVGKKSYYQRRKLSGYFARQCWIGGDGKHSACELLTIEVLNLLEVALQFDSEITTEEFDLHLEDPRASLLYTSKLLKKLIKDAANEKEPKNRKKLLKTYQSKLNRLIKDAAIEKGLEFDRASALLEHLSKEITQISTEEKHG